MDKILETVERIWENSFIQALVYLVIALVSAWIASFIVKKLCKLFRLDRWEKQSERSGTAIKFIGKLTFLIVFLLFLPAVFSALGLENVSDPITDFVSTFIGYLPNVIAALILVFIGIFIGQILEEVVATLLAKTKIDNLTKKISDDGNTEIEGIKISLIIGKIVNALVVLIAIVEAMTVLNIDAISTPATAIINAVFGAVPKIILAGIVIAIGIFIAKVVCGLIGNLLSGLNLDGMIDKMIPGVKDRISVSKVITNVVRALIIIFVIAEGVKILGFEIFTGIMKAIIAYLPMIIKAIVIAIVAFFGANALSSFIKKSMPEAKAVATLARSIIYVIAAFMILSQLNFATAIVNYAFIISLSALAVAFAIAFGIGGRDFAKKTLENVKLPEGKTDKKEN